MKRFLVVLLAVFIFSCGGETVADISENESSEIVSNTLNHENSQEKETELVENYVPANEDGLWQIDDYAELMRGKKIYTSWDDVPEDEKGGGDIYETLDLKGGYANVTGAYEGWSEFVIWRMADGNDLLGSLTAGCGPACSYDFDFTVMKDGLEVRDGNSLIPWKEIDAHRDKMMPKIMELYGGGLDYPEDDQYVFIFPQKGTSMQVDLLLGADEVQLPLLKLKWNKEFFSIEERYTTFSEG